MRIERQVVFWIGVFLFFVLLLWLLREVLLPFVVGAALAYMLDPLAERLTRHGISRLAAALIILAAFVIIFAGFLILVGPLLAAQLASFIDNVPAYVHRLETLVTDHPWLKSVLGTAASGDKSVSALLNKSMGYLTEALPALWSKGAALLSVFSLLVITPVVAFYLLADWDRVIATVDNLIPLPQRDTVRGIFGEIDRALSGYLHGQFLVCAILGVYYAIGLTLAGLSYGALIGVVSGFLTFIPYVGSFTALVVSFGVAVAQFFPDWSRIIIIVVIVLVGQFFEGNVLAPRLVGKSVGLHPVWLIFALLAGGYLVGFVGLVLSVPLAAAAGVLTRFALGRYRASTLYTGKPPT
jgi:predicted PurR-regulated permease PerM